MKRRVMRCARI